MPRHVAIRASSLTSHQETMASYSHARQVEVVASLDTAGAEAGVGISDTHRQGNCCSYRPSIGKYCETF